MTSHGRPARVLPRPHGGLAVPCTDVHPTPPLSQRQYPVPTSCATGKSTVAPVAKRVLTYDPLRHSKPEPPACSNSPFSVPTGTATPSGRRSLTAADTLDKHPRIRGATVTDSVCPYCAVGCGTHIYTKGGEVIDIEGNPDSPINEGTLCPKGANTFQLHHNPHRVKHVLWRAPVFRPVGDRSRWTGRWSGSPQLREGDARRGVSGEEREGQVPSTPSPTWASSAGRRWTTKKTT